MWSFNGAWTVLIDTHRNHRQEWVVELFADVARVASGSFGFLHVWDDEHPVEREQFIRHAMVHGRITATEEVALRPVVRRWYADFEDGRPAPPDA